jgi:probable HAF family extracellular repeat protein
MRSLRKVRPAQAVAIFAGLILTWAAPAKAQRTYTVTDLGSVAGTFQTDAEDINNRGEATVDSIGSFFPVVQSFGFVSKGGQITLLPSLGGQFTFAFGINNAGTVVGSANFAGDTIGHAALWDRNANTVNDLGTLGGPTSTAIWINDRGQVVGSSVIANGVDTHAFLLDKGKMSDLGTLGGSTSSAGTVSNNGIVIGESDISTAIDPMFGIPQFHGFVWNRGVLTDMGEIFGGHFNLPFGINNQGDIIGAADVAGDLTGHAFIIRGGKLTDLGTLPEDTNSAANAMNNSGQIVGMSSLAFGPEFGVPPILTAQCPCHAVIWENGKITDLNTLIPATSGWQLSVASDINDRGQIIGNGTINGGQDFRAFLLTPQEGNSTSSSATSTASVTAAAGPPPVSGVSADATRIIMVKGKQRIIRLR